MPTRSTPRSASRILLVESEREIVRVLCAVLERQRYCVRSFRSSDAALHAFNTESFFDLLVTDRSPVGLPGLSLVAALRERGFTGPAIILVDSITPAESLEAERLGVERILHKPFSTDSFLASLLEVLPSSENRSEKPK
ncbi:MAG: response regulator [Opitutaceae bacterium]|nr:response regulator [Opitutaceae bacterium]